MSKTDIEWAHPIGFDGETWNPTLGCSKISPGCKYCYAIRSVNRMAGNPNPKIAAANAGLVVMTGAGLNWTGKVNAIESRLAVPLKKRKPTCWFVNSLSDLFHEEIPDEFIDKVFAVMAECPQHRFQVLTKRPERMHAWATRSVMGVRLQTAWGRIRKTGWGNGPERPWPLPNVWLGTSAENQATADDRIPWLLRTPAAIRFLSYEPALGPLRLWKLASLDYHENTVGYETYPLIGMQAVPDCDWEHPRLNWVIAGGESGPGARPMNPGWARAVRDDCVKAKVSFFFKQWGEWSPDEPANFRKVSNKRYSHETFGWTRDGREYISLNPGPDDFPSTMMYRVGKKASGAILDGKLWREFPQ